MARTPDRRHGPLYEEAIFLDDTQLAESAAVIRYTGGSFSFRDATGEFDPRLGGAGFDVDLVVTSRSVGEAVVFRASGNVVTFR
jgi:hypothetical protein